jgi:hypothetical protein
MEQSKTLHLIIAILSGYLFAVFAWWWWEYKRATTIYGVTCFLMLGIFLTHIGAWYLYVLADEQDIVLLNLTAWYWPIRQYLMIIPLACYVCHVTKRAWRGNMNTPRRRRTDK